MANPATKNSTADCEELTHTAADTAVESVILFFIMITSFVANLSIIIVVLRNHSLRRNGHNLLILNLALADFGTTVGSMFITFVAILNDGKLLQQENNILCSVNLFMSTTFYLANFGAINLIAIHRYLLVVQSNRLNVTLNHVYVMMATCWVLSALITLPSATGNISPVLYDCNIHHCRVQWEDSDEHCMISVCFVSISFLTSVTVMVFCYTSIAIEIRNSQHKINAFRQRVRSSIRRLTGKKETEKQVSNFQVEGDCSSSTQMSTTEESAFQGSASTEEDKDSGLQIAHEKRRGMLIKNWNEYEAEYQEICHTLRRAGSVLNKASTITKSRYKNKSTVDMRDRTLRSVLGADKLVAIAGALVILTSTVCRLPHTVTQNCMFYDVWVKRLPHGVHILTRWMAYSNCALDPLIYTMFNRGLRAALVNGYGRMYRKLKLYL